MTRDESLKLDSNTPVRLADGQFGVLIRWFDSTVGVQVYGEENIREVSIDRLKDMGDGALVEVQP